MGPIGRAQVSREAEIVARLEATDVSVGEQSALVRELRVIGTAASVGVLRVALHSGDVNLTIDAVAALARIGSDEAVDVLTECLDTGPGPRLTMAAVSLRRLRARRAVPAIVRCLEQRRDDLRPGQKRLLILALGEMPHVSELPVLSAALLDRSYRPRSAAAWALAQIRSPESADALETTAKQLPWLRALPLRRALRIRRGRADQG